MIRKLAKSIREYKTQTILTPILVVVEVLMECLIPYMIAMLVNEVKAGCGMDVIVDYAVKLAAMALISLGFGAAAGNTAAAASAGFAKNLRKDMFHSVQDYSFENIDKFSTSSLVTRMTTDIANVQMAFMMLIRAAVRCPIMFIFAFIMALIMGGKMAWVFVFVVPILGIVLIMITLKVRPLFQKVFKKYDKLNESIQENIKGMRVVKTFVREGYEKEKFDTAAEDVRKDFTKAERVLALNMPVMQFCMYIVMIFVLSFGSYTIITSKGLDLDVGQMSSLLTYGMMILTSLMMLSMVVTMITMSVESAQRIVEVIDEESVLVNPENPVYEVKDGSISFENVDFKYSKDAKRRVLKEINLDIKSGETIGIIGSTGSAKSSLIQLIPRLYDATTGTVKVGGLDVRKYDIKTLRDAVAVVLQKNVLFSGTIKENLRWGNADATDEQIKEACKLSCADEFIDTFPDGYDTYIEQGGSNVSGGQKQRLCIARALLKKPKILILDDSTSAVDTKTDAKIRKAMAEFIPETTKIIIAQRTASVEDADRIIVLKDGGVIDAVGTHEELLVSNEIYRGVYISQNKEGNTIGE